MDENLKISRRDALKTIGAACLTAAIATTPFASCVANAKKEEEKKDRVKRMIFFFSATGNSLYVAREIGGENATLLSIPQEIHNENPIYEAELPVVHQGARHRHQLHIFRSDGRYLSPIL